MTATSFDKIRTIVLRYPRHHEFCGRDEVIRKMHQILQPLNKRKICVLYGKGGSGKTQLAIEYTYRYEGLRKKIFWIDATDETTVISSGRSILEALVLQYAKDFSPSPPDYKKISIALDCLCGIDLRTGEIYRTFYKSAWKTVKRWLAHNQDWLLIVVNNDIPDSVDMQDKIIPLCDWGHIIVTTRRSELAGILGDSIAVDDLRPADGLRSGDEHPHTLIIVEYMAIIYKSQGNYAKL